ncbi:Chromatin remodeling protein SHL [Fusarium oxysporum f. sp. raphani]|uniref:Chromatin remodeling protein SHL n=1 Tax=Fusarium oxysporum f. sp. raphani TaxID=96318 RepID=A0A8J5NU33_FUSOX|nr:Chromatin remodeling protein SHL [Fusarium oxysporum f. sp. raphani]
MSKRKRSLSVGEDNCAEFPFTVSYKTGDSPAHQKGHKNKTRKYDGQDENNRAQSQISPFNPKGSFKTYESMDLKYTVEPEKRWRNMTRYNSFILNENKYYSGAFVYVANELSIEKQKAQDNGKDICENKDEWVARILEIRASDEHHVYARVYWMYWPDELPAKTVDGKKEVQGRQPYHGVNELIASNHMDIINVVSVTGLATVDQWIESHTKKLPEELYWRQAFDYRNLQLSSVELICECQEPANPDKIVLECTNSKCGKSLHEECMTHKILMQVHERLSLDKANVSQWLAGKEQKPKATHPLSPLSTEEKETRRIINVRSDKTNDGLHCKKAAHETDREVGSVVGGRTPFGAIATALANQSAKKGHKKARKKPAGLKPYEGFFKATLKMKDGRPTAWEIRDLRESVIGGDKSWTENVHCLLCGSVID